MPDLTVLLDLPPEVGLARARGRRGRRPAGVGVAGLPPAGAGRPSGRWPRPTRPVPGARRQQPPTSWRRDPAAGGRAALRLPLQTLGEPPAAATAHGRGARRRVIRTPRRARPPSCTRDRAGRGRGLGARSSASPAVVEELRAAVAHPAAMTHAWLFTGPPGLRPVGGRPRVRRGAAVPGRRVRHLPRLPHRAGRHRTPTCRSSSPRGCRSAVDEMRASWCGSPAGRRRRAAGRSSSSRTPTG